MTPNDVLAHLTPEAVLERYPELAERFCAEGAKRERERIQAVEAQCLPGFEDLIQQLKFDGKTTGGEAASLILVADKKLCLQKAQDYVVHRLSPLPLAASWEEESYLRLTHATPEERWTAEYHQSPDLQGEFLGKLETYLAFKKAEANGQINIIKR